MDRHSLSKKVALVRASRQPQSAVVAVARQVTATVGPLVIPAAGAVGRRGAGDVRQVALPTLFSPVVCGEAQPSREPASLHRWRPGVTVDLVVR
jgi:hypothetical protein